MNGLFFLHSPMDAQALHVGFLSAQPVGAGGGFGATHRKGSAWTLMIAEGRPRASVGRLMLRITGALLSHRSFPARHQSAEARSPSAAKETRLRSHHFVAVHLIPFTGGHPACIDAGSISFAGVMLQNTKASLRAVATRSGRQRSSSARATAARGSV